MSVLLKSLWCRTEQRIIFLEGMRLEMPRQHHTVENNLLPQSLLQHDASSVSWWFRGHRKWCWLSVPFVFLQKESVTWQWTQIRWQCPCRTPTPGRQPWTTWGCLPLGSLDSNSCQVLHWLNFTSPTRTTDSFVLKSYFNIKLAKIGIKASVFCFHPDVGDVWIFSH